VFAAGAITYRMVNAIVARTKLITDPEAMAKVDTELAAHVTGWGGLSMAKTQNAIDYWVDRYDPHALRRTESRSRDRHLDVVPADDGGGLAWVQGRLNAHDGAALDQKLAALAHTVCDRDPRALDQRRADAAGALAAGADRLACECGSPDCTAALGGSRPEVVVHVIADEDSLTDDTPVQLDGKTPPRSGPDKPLRETTLSEALAPEPPTGPAHTAPAAIIGGGIIPGPLLAAKLATTATIRPVVHPGDAPPERGYVPSRALADFVRCRDMTCRFPGCDEPAYRCDLDHTIAHPVGPTCASNLKTLCRKHHLLKTFCGGADGWRDRQLPDGTIVWISPRGQTYTTYPGSRILFPPLCRPTAPVTISPTAAPESGRSLAMPRRTRTRAENRQRAIEAERRLNDAYVAERNKPPPL
jgi:Domain of unknown function (DUF222)